jgi:hypothetical protein
MDDRMSVSTGTTSRITDTGRKGDIRIAFGFERGDVDNKPEPVMYVSTVRRPQLVASVPLSLLYLFDTRTAHDTATAVTHATTVARAVYGQEPTRMEVHRVLSAIEDWATDLKNMPPPSTWRNSETVEQVLEKHGFDVVR